MRSKWKRFPPNKAFCFFPKYLGRWSWLLSLAVVQRPHWLFFHYYLPSSSILFFVLMVQVSIHPWQDFLLLLSSCSLAVLCGLFRVSMFLFFPSAIFVFFSFFLVPISSSLPLAFLAFSFSLPFLFFSPSLPISSLHPLLSLTILGHFKLWYSWSNIFSYSLSPDFSLDLNPVMSFLETASMTRWYPHMLNQGQLGSTWAWVGW